MIPIIIINWNGIEDTEECINSVLSMNNASFHIHLIDNGSDDHNVLKINNLYSNHSKITLHMYNKNLGFSKAHIKLWDDHLKFESNVDFIALLNNDTIVDPNWLSELLKCAQTNKASVISSKMVNYYNREIMDNAGHKMINTGEIVPIGHNQPISDYTKEQENFGACAGACLYRKTMIDDIGFFDSHFTTGYEDAELGLRAKVSNYRCIFAPNAIVYHKMGQSIKKIFNQDYALMIQSNILYSYFKLMPLKNIIVHIPSFVVKYASMLVIDIIFWRISYLKILFRSWKNTWQNRSLIMKKRKAFFQLKSYRVNSFKMAGGLHFFFWFDLVRFWRIIVRGENSAIDRYHNK